MVALIIPIITALFLLVSSQALAGYGATLCKEKNFTCYVTKRGDSWAKLFPDSDQRNVAMRINRMNVKLHPGMKIALPNTENWDLMSYSPFPTQIDPPGEKIIYVSKKSLAFGAYNANGTLQYWGPISSAKGYCPDLGKSCRTPSGTYAIQYKQGAGCVSSKFPIGRGGAPMPYCMFFHGGFALHGSYEVPGYNDSHGCVRMFVDDAQWLNQEFTADEPHVRVVVY